jgi:hypothetical protein
MKSGHIYVLTHPSNPNLYKVGITIRAPKARLAQHNSDFTKAAGRIVQETGQEWELKEFHLVDDPYWAEKAFWSRIPQSAIPYRGGVEVEIMTWEEVNAGLAAAKSAGVRPQSLAVPVYGTANNIIVKKRLVGRGIALLGHVKSIVSGRNDFECSNGHKWRTRPKLVMDGDGCPECGMGARTPEDMDEIANAGYICLLTDSSKPGFVSIGVKRGSIDQISKDYPWGAWEIHRYRHVEEIDLAESLIWELLGKPLPHSRDPIEKDLADAEEAMRSLIYALRDEISFEDGRINLRTAT